MFIQNPPNNELTSLKRIPKESLFLDTVTFGVIISKNVV